MHKVPLNKGKGKTPIMKTLFHTKPAVHIRVIIKETAYHKEVVGRIDSPLGFYSNEEPVDVFIGGKTFLHLFRTYKKGFPVPVMDMPLVMFLINYHLSSACFKGMGGNYLTCI